MTTIRRGGYLFRTWLGDHDPRHVHVYQDRRLVVRWDLQAGVPIEGAAPRRVVEIIRQLRSEGLL
jgi:hypothetical protein